MSSRRPPPMALPRITLLLVGILLVGILTVTTSAYAREEEAVPTKDSENTLHQQQNRQQEKRAIPRSSTCCNQPLATTSTRCSETGFIIGSNTLCCPSGGQLSYSLTNQAGVLCNCGTELQECDNIEEEGDAPKVRFKCDGSSLLPLSAVDDDYCDCLDGSDEPRTSACSPVGNFLCGNDGFKPKLIVTSRVNDGVCDCCDGSDENSGALECVNTCGTKAAALKVLLKQRNERLAAGFAVRDVRMEAKAAELEKHRSKSFDAVAELQEVREKVTALNYQVETAQEEEKTMNDERVAKFMGGVIEKAMMLDVASADDVANVLCRLILEAGVQGVNKFYELANDHLVNGGAHFDREDVAEKEVVLDMLKEREERAQGESVVTTTEDIDALKLKLLVTEIQFDNENESTKGYKESLALLTRSIAMAVKQVDVMRQAAKALVEGTEAESSWSDEAVDAAVALLDPIKTGKLTELVRKLEALEMTKTAKERTAQKSQDLEGLDFGPNNTLFLLFDECISKKIGEYKYEVCGYKTAKQAKTKLGNFDRIEFLGGETDDDDGSTSLDPSMPHISAIMYFVDGQNCYGAGKRTAAVKLTCGDEDELLGVEEPNKCEYELTMRSPGACMGAIIVEEEVMRQAVRKARSSILGNIKEVFTAAFTWVGSFFV